MQIDWWTLALQTVNFAVLAWLLHRFLYKPVLGMIDKRRADVDQRFSKADEARNAAEEEVARLAAEREEIASERTAALMEAADEADRRAAQRRQQAESEAEALLEDTRRELARERNEATGAVRQAALDLGTDIARRLLDEIPPDLRTRAWLERIEQHLATLPAKERDEIHQSLEEKSELRVVTAASLPEDMQDLWRTRLSEALPGEAAVTFVFDTDPALIAGAELHFANATLRFSWRSALKNMRQEVEAHADTY